MKKFCIKLGLYALVALIVSNLIAVGCFMCLRNSDMFKPSFLIRNIPVDSEFDYVVLGTSTAFTGIDTQLVDSLLQINGINIALDGMSYEGQAMMLSHFIAHGFKTNYCILGIDRSVSYKQDVFSMNEFYFLPFINEDYVYDSFYNREHDWLKIRAYSRYCPILGLAYYNQQLYFSSLLAAIKPHYRHRFNQKGNTAYPDTHLSSEQHEKTSDTITHVNNAVSAIEQICKDNNIKLIWYLPPRSGNTIVDSVFNQNRIIINSRELFEGKEDLFMYDFVHVNSKGRAKATMSLCDSLINRGLLMSKFTEN
ncbi:hypothetical protein EZS27_026364 [termite gut metagenome]|uniref:SGNH/GDSL hydrolase family protein n=1 Tax=termite gut metagenome TaxID=433724 RepID=A0A5J4QTR2_9ZZZZ